MLTHAPAGGYEGAPYIVSSKKRGQDAWNALRCIRVFHDLRQSEAAKRLGISRSYLSEIESGLKEPTLQRVLRYAEVFQLPASSILFFSENMGGAGTRSARHFISNKMLALMRFVEARANDHVE